MLKGTQPYTLKGFEKQRKEKNGRSNKFKSVSVPMILIRS